MSYQLIKLKYKIAVGYVGLTILFISALLLVYFENQKLGAANMQANELLAERQITEEVVNQILDMALLGEQMIVWGDEEIAEHFEKKDSAISSLIKLKQGTHSATQRHRIDTIISLLEEKEGHILAILDVRHELRGLNGVEGQRIPAIIQQTKEHQEQLAETVNENLEKTRKKINGLKGVFYRKKKIREHTDMENKRVLESTQSQSKKMLQSFANEIYLSREGSLQQLTVHFDSLNSRNNFLNKEISRMALELSQEDQLRRQIATEKYQTGQKRALWTISATVIAALILSIFLYWRLHLDLNERYRNRIRLEQLNRKNEELLHARQNMMLTVSHDLRSPLAAITGYAELISGERRKENRERYSGAIRQSSNRMLLLLNSLLNFYRLDSGKECPENNPFRLKGIPRILMTEFMPLAEKKGLKFSGEYFGEDVVVTGDRSRLLQILGNLVSNAIKFTIAGSVRVVLDYANGQLTAKVEDSGRGMSKEQTEKIFQPFERLTDAETEDGFGLGLPVVLALVQLLGGRIEVDSFPGKGSVFTVQLPLPISTEENISHRDKALAKTNLLPQGLRIALVDNDAIMRVLTSEMFSRQKVRCDACRDARELMDRMRGCPYDLVITDIVMPETNGFQLLELLRTSNIRHAVAVPVLAMTARAERNPAEFVKAGFAGCLYKPFSCSELFEAVIHCTNGHPSYPLPCADFSVVLSGERNRTEMLGLLASETKKNMALLNEGLLTGDRDAMSILAHQLVPLWEIVRVDAPLKDFQETLQKADATDGVIHAAAQKVLVAGGHLVDQTRKLIERNGYE